MPSVRTTLGAEDKWNCCVCGWYSNPIQFPGCSNAPHCYHNRCKTCETRIFHAFVRSQDVTQRGRPAASAQEDLEFGGEQRHGPSTVLALHARPSEAAHRAHFETTAVPTAPTSRPPPPISISVKDRHLPSGQQSQEPAPTYTLQTGQTDAKTAPRGDQYSGLYPSARPAERGPKHRLSLESLGEADTEIVAVQPSVSPTPEGSKEPAPTCRLQSSQPYKKVKTRSSGFPTSLAGPGLRNLEGHQPGRLSSDATGAEISQDAVRTRIERSLVSVEVLDRAGLRYEAVSGVVAVLGVLDAGKIEELTRASQQLRAERQSDGLPEISRATTPEHTVHISTSAALSRADLSAWSSMLSKITKQTGETSLGTPLTTITDQSNSVHKGVGQNLENAVVEMESDEPSQPTTSQLELDDQGSVSQGSTIYIPEQVEDVVSRFSRAVLRQLRFRLGCDASDDYALHYLLRELRNALKVFSEDMITDGSAFFHARISKMIRRLRPQIARRIHEGARRADTLEEKRHEVSQLGLLGEMSYVDKIQVLWAPKVTPSISGQSQDRMPSTLAYTTDAEDEPIPPVSRPSTPASSVISVQTNDSLGTDDTMQDGLYGRNINPAEILKNLTSSDAFEALTRDTERILDMYTCDKMRIICQRIALNLRRSALPRCDDGNYRVTFHVEWDLSGFLTRNYAHGVNQYVKKIAATTGTADAAVLCSVGEYFRSQWPNLSSTLIDAISTVCGPRKMFQRFWTRSARDRSQGAVLFDQTLRICSVHGNEGFIVSIGQQLSWLAAAFSEKPEALSYAFVSLCEAETHPLTHASFKVDVKVCPVSRQGGQSRCWSSLLGPAVIIPGFPVPPRDIGHLHHGLETSISAMAAMAGISQAISFEGGFVFKGRCHALVPVSKVSNAIQWHMLDTYPEKLGWQTIREKCPMLLKGHIKSYAKLRSFVGWYPEALELLGTSHFDYASVQYSGATKPPSSLKIDKLEVGFSQWGALNAGITLGKHQGYKAQRPDNYEALLDDAREMPVIIYDTSKRAMQSNAEDLILHVLLHRQTRSAAKKTGTSLLDGASPDRRLKSTRDTMRTNAEVIVGVYTQLGRPGEKPVYFKDEVNRLYTTLDALWDMTSPESSGSDIFELNLSRNRVNGWEYMSLVKESMKYLPPRSVDLGRTNGGWHRYAQDVRALTLFTSGFGDIYQPSKPDAMCPTCLSPPSADCALTVRVDAVMRLFEQQGCQQSRAQLTDSGWTIQADEDPFRACGNTCQGPRMVHLVRRPPGGGTRYFVHRLPEDGVILIGKPVRSMTRRFFSHILPPRSVSNPLAKIPILATTGVGHLGQNTGGP